MTFECFTCATDIGDKMLFKCYRLDDLTPGTEYSVKLSVGPIGDSGATPTTILASFVTLPAPPAPPPQPKLSSRTKNTLVIK